MKVLYERVAGIDVHKDMIKVAIRSPGDKPWTRKTEILEFRTFYGVLQEMARLLRRRGVTHVVMEASGVYTEPVYYALREQDFEEVAVINPAHAKALKGHKTTRLPNYRKKFLRSADGWGSWWLRSRTMITEGDAPRDLCRLAVPLRGSLEATGDLFEPYRLVDGHGVVVVPAAAYFRELAACGRPANTQRSYGMDLLRWWRFIWAIGCGWDEATRAEARDFCSWIQLAGKPVRPHWRYPGGGAPGTVTARTAPGTPNRVTGKPSAGRGYATATVVHCESVLRGFYEFHLQAGSGPIVNPFPLARGRRTRADAHRNPMDPFPGHRAGRYRLKARRPILRQIPDEKFDELFAELSSNRDRALVAFWVSTGARASELLGATVADADPGQQLITVIRKGTRSLQQVPASPDAFVWLRLYQAQMQGLVPAGRDQPLWWTLRRPFRALTYDAARLMFTRANAALGANWSLHDLRHSAAYQMARDPDMPLTDIQWVLGHAHLSTTQQYLTPLTRDVIASVLAFHDRQREPGSAVSPLAAGYRAESLKNLFGEKAL